MRGLTQKMGGGDGLRARFNSSDPASSRTSEPAGRPVDRSPGDPDIALNTVRAVASP